MQKQTKGRALCRTCPLSYNRLAHELVCVTTIVKNKRLYQIILELSDWGLSSISRRQSDNNHKWSCMQYCFPCCFILGFPFSFPILVHLCMHECTMEREGRARNVLLKYYNTNVQYYHNHHHQGYGSWHLWMQVPPPNSQKVYTLTHDNFSG